MLSVARSRLALVVQLSFLGLHSIALLLGTIYTYNTPQLYENNSHNKVGWIVTWVVVTQCIMGVVKLAASFANGRDSASEEPVSFPQMTTGVLEQQQHDQLSADLDPYRYSEDRGHYTASQSSRSQSVSSTATYTQDEQQKLHEYEAGREDDLEHHHSEKQGLLGHRQVERVAMKFSSVLSQRTLRVIDMAYNLIDRTILLMGFVAFITGAAVYGGIFVSLFKPCITIRAETNNQISEASKFSMVLHTPSKAVYSSGTGFSLLDVGWAVSSSTAGRGILDRQLAWSVLAKLVFHRPSLSSRSSSFSMALPMFS